MQPYWPLFITVQIFRLKLLIFNGNKAYFGNLTLKMFLCLLRQNRWTKRGIAVVPTKFGISFTAAFLNQVYSTLTWDDGYQESSRPERTFLRCMSSPGWGSGSYLHWWFCTADSWRNWNGSGSSHQDGPGTATKQSTTSSILTCFNVNNSVPVDFSCMLHQTVIIGRTKLCYSWNWNYKL